MKWLMALLALAVSLPVSGQKSRPSFTIHKAQGPIRVDGVANEPDWQAAEVVKELVQQFPNDTSRSRLRTEFRLTYDDRFIYVNALAYDNTKGSYVLSSLRRDFRGGGLDGVSVVIDPFQDVTNGFFFGVSPAGVQREGLISNGWLVNEDLDLSWDNKWYAESYIGENFYSVEMAIPFKTLRYKPGNARWNIKLYRIDSKENERSVWPFTPRNFEPGNLNYAGEMIWDTPPVHPGPNISVIPYVAGLASRNYLADPTEARNNAQIGGDAKIAVTSSLNLDLTVNPDFSQVEVDRQVTNLDRFELFFPERRQFFLENADLFSSYGHIFARPFFSRRIGVSRDTATGQNIQNQIPFGLRLSGNLNKYWRMGLLNMQTAEIKSANVPSYNHTVATVQRRVGSNSNIRGILVNRQLIRNDTLDFRPAGYFYNRVAGIDYNYNFRDNRWTGNVFFHKQFTENTTPQGFAHGYNLSHNTRSLNLNWFHQVIGRDYNPADGYVPRNGYKRISPSGSFFIYPQSQLINNHGPTFDMAFIWDDTFGFTDRELNYGWAAVLQNQAVLLLNYRNTYTFLFNDFDPTNSPREDNAEKLPAQTGYTYGNVNLNFISDPRDLFNFQFTAVAGNYFNGQRYGFSGLFNYRYQPYGVFSLDLNYNRIVLPAPYATADIYLVGPRVDLTLTRSVFFTSFFQYNSQFKNVNINSRLQWRFKPVSDLFIVYTDNYYYSFDEPRLYSNFFSKNRALVVKLTYWFNL